MGTLLYDADCGFCMRTARLVPRLGMRVRMDSIQAADLVALRVDPVRALREMPFVHDDGSVSYGHRAWAAVLANGPLPHRIVGRLMVAPVLDRLSAGVYRWVSEHRGRLPGGTPACSIETVATSREQTEG
jgi:predicted DCC family thiol-disulfide oxidoreductase YuxK